MEDRENLEGFTIRPYRSKRLNEYCKRMSQDDLSIIFDDNVYAALQLQSLPVEESPRSVYKVEKLYEALQAYSPKNNFNLRFDDNIKAGVALAYKCFARGNHQMLHILPLVPETVELVTSNPKGSPGLTNYGVSKTESKVRALARAKQTLEGVKGTEACIAFKRTQFNDKTRLVWGYPYSMTLIEGLVAYPLLQKFKGGWTPMAFAMTSGYLGTKLRVASYHSKWAYSIDMTQFDSSICGRLINIAFQIIQTWFDPEEVEPTTGRSVREILHLVEKYFITTPIVMPNSMIYIGKNHGVPSGSFFTQMVDSIVNVIVAGALSANFHMNVDRERIFVLGDDLLMWSDRLIDLDDMAKYVNRYLGIKMHGSEKSNVYHFDETIHFLGRDWTKGVPSLDSSEILKRMLYPERFRKYSSDPVIRDRQVTLLLLSYASTYWGAWNIIQEALGSNLWYLQDPELIDRRVYDANDRLELDPDHLSGLTRYQMKYGGFGRKSRFTTTATNFWS